MESVPISGDDANSGNEDVEAGVAGATSMVSPSEGLAWGAGEIASTNVLINLLATSSLRISPMTIPGPYKFMSLSIR